MKFNAKVSSILLTVAFVGAGVLSSCSKKAAAGEETAVEYVYETNKKGDTVTDKKGKPIPLTDENGAEVTLPVTTPPLLTDEHGSIVPGQTNPKKSSDSETEKEEPVPVPVKVGFIYEGKVDGNTLNLAFEQARKEMTRLMGIETGYIENVLVQQYHSAVEALEKEGFNVIVSASNSFVTAAQNENTPATQTAADGGSGSSSAEITESRTDTAETEPEEFKTGTENGVVFITYGGTNTGVRQSSVEPALFQPANICGLVSAYNTDTNIIGMIIDNNMFNAYGIADAFTLGAKELPKSNVEVNLNWALSDSDEDTKSAIDDLISKGCDTIFFYQASEFGIRYCERLAELGLPVKVTGFAENIAGIAPKSYLTGFFPNLSTYLTEEVRSAATQTFNGTLQTQGLRHGLVGIIPLSENAKVGSKEIFDTIYQMIYENKSSVFNGEIRDKSNVIRVYKGTSLPSEQISRINWLDSHINEVKNFSKPRTEKDLTFSDLTIKK